VIHDLSHSILQYIFFLFFLYCYGHPRHLHSFPTRRSSDLVEGAPPAPAPPMWPPAVPELTPRAPAAPPRRPAPPPRATRRGRGRSEEHTSELQSLAYLVCRLLLEKKKKEAKHQESTTPKSA